MPAVNGGTTFTGMTTTRSPRRPPSSYLTTRCSRYGASARMVSTLSQSWKRIRRRSCPGCYQSARGRREHGAPPVAGPGARVLPRHQRFTRGRAWATAWKQASSATATRRAVACHRSGTRIVGPAVTSLSTSKWMPTPWCFMASPDNAQFLNQTPG